MGTLLNTAVRAGAWMGIGLVTQRVFGLASFLILARLLTPTDFGMIALGFSIVGAAESLTTPGFERAVVQRRDSGEKFLDPIWTLNLLKGVVLFFALWVLAPWIVIFFNAEGAASILRAMGGLFLLQASANVGQLYFSKELDYRSVYLRDTAGQAAYLVVALSWGLFSPSAWALAAGHLARYAVSSACTYILHPYRPRLSLEFRRLREIGWFGAWATAQTAWSYFSRVLDNFFVARWLGPQALGFYAKGRDLAWLPLSPIITIIGKVSFPTYARLQQEPGRVREGLLKSSHMALFLAFPTAAVFAAHGEGVVSVLLGERWIPMAGPLKALTAAMLLRCLLEIGLPALEALGRPDLRLRSEFIQGIISLALLYPAITRYGTAGAGWAVAAGAAASLAYTLRALRRVSALRVIDFTAPAVIPALCSLPILASAPWLSPVSFHPAAYLGTLAGLGGVYLALLVLCGKLNAGPYPVLCGLWRTWRTA